MWRLLNLPQWAELLLVFSVVAVWGAIEAWFERRKQRWPVVAGMIVGKPVLMEVDKDVHYTREISYSYDVNGQHYFGAQETYAVDLYPRGTRVMVHYKPSDPWESRLDVKEMRAREDAADESDESEGLDESEDPNNHF